MNSTALAELHVGISYSTEELHGTHSVPWSITREIAGSPLSPLFLTLKIE